MRLTSASHPSDVSIQGDFYDGRGSRPIPARLRVVDGNRVELVMEGDIRPLSQDDIRIASRLGNSPRYLYLPDDAVFETADNDGVDALSRQWSSTLWHRLLHRLESNLGWIAVAAVVTIAIGAFVFLYGVPWTARLVAHALPLEVHEYVGEQTLTTLDENWLEPSQLPEERRESLQQLFGEYLKAEDVPGLRVVFRDGGWIGANALALADGTIIFTDQMVELAEDDRELLAILGHEIGHVERRHGMQGMVQSQLAFWVMVAITGDLSSASETTASIPAVLFNLGYSRDMEREADTYALRFLEKHSIAPEHFAHIMTRLTTQHETVADEPAEADQDKEEEEGAADVLGGFLSTHPATEERIQRFRGQ